MSSKYATHTGPVQGSYMSELVPVYIDKTFTVFEKQDVVDAVAEWNMVLNGYRQYRIESDHFDMEVSVLEQVKNTKRGLIILALHEEQMPDDVSSNVLAWVPELGAPVVFVAIDRFGESWELKHVVMHEIAHTMGVPHINVQGSLMSPYYQAQTNCIDRLTVQQLSFLHKNAFWNWQHMNYCDRP